MKTAFETIPKGPRPRVARIHAFISSLLISSIAVAGCRATPPPSTPYATASPRVLDARPIQAAPEFKQAENRFRAGDRQGALNLIHTLHSDPKWTDSDRAYLQRQRQIVEGIPPISRATSPRTDRAPEFHVVKDCGPRALQIALTRLGIRSDFQKLIKSAGSGNRGTSLEGLANAAESAGIRAEGVQVDATAIRKLSNPAVAWWSGNHYVAVLKITGDSATIRDPNEYKEEVIQTDELLRKSGGILLTLSK